MISVHDIYKSIWTPIIGEELVLETKDSNKPEQHAVAVKKDGCIVGHVPHLISQESWFYLKHSGHILCHVTGKQKRDVGLEVPCMYAYVIRVMPLRLF